MLEVRQLVQDVGGRRNRIGAEEERYTGQFGSGDEAKRGGLVAGQAAIGAGGNCRTADFVGADKKFGRFSVGVASA